MGHVGHDRSSDPVLSPEPCNGGGALITRPPPRRAAIPSASPLLLPAPAHEGECPLLELPGELLTKIVILAITDYGVTEIVPPTVGGFNSLAPRNVWRLHAIAMVCKVLHRVANDPGVGHLILVSACARAHCVSKDILHPFRGRNGCVCTATPSSCSVPGRGGYTRAVWI